MKITTISETLGYTIDTYSLFDPYEAIAEDDWTDDTEIDHEKYVRDLAEHQAEVLNSCIDRYAKTASILKGFKCTGSSSPREYNFATDSSELEIEFNSVNLMAYIKANMPEFEEYLKENFTSYDGFMSYVENDWAGFHNQLKNGDSYDINRSWSIMIGWYMRRELLEEEEYRNDMYDGLSEIAYNNASNLAEVN